MKMAENTNLLFNPKYDLSPNVPIREYLLRHNKAIFWVIESMIPFGNHPLFLLLLGWMLPPKPAFMKITTTPISECVPTRIFHLTSI